MRTLQLPTTTIGGFSIASIRATLNACAKPFSKATLTVALLSTYLIKLT